MDNLDNSKPLDGVNVVHDDEPQFSIPTEGEDKKKANYNKAIVILFLVLSAVLIVAKFDHIKTTLFGAESSKTTQVAEPASQPVMPDYQVSEPVEQSAPKENQQPISAPSAPVTDAVNIVLANKISELTEGMTVLTGHLVTVNTELQAIKDAQSQSDKVILSGLQRIADGLEQIKVRDGQSEKVLAGVISDIRGFKKTLKDERLKFSLKVLHVESYGGQLRIIGFEESAPQNVLKLYVGDVFGLWRVQHLSESKAVFVHVDGVEHAEVISR